MPYPLGLQDIFTVAHGIFCFVMFTHYMEVSQKTRGPDTNPKSRALVVSGHPQDGPPVYRNSQIVLMEIISQPA